MPFVTSTEFTARGGKARSAAAENVCKRKLVRAFSWIDHLVHIRFGRPARQRCDAEKPPLLVRRGLRSHTLGSKSACRSRAASPLVANGCAYGLERSSEKHAQDREVRLVASKKEWNAGQTRADRC
jgi:hypothetical protein